MSRTSSATLAEKVEVINLRALGLSSSVIAEQVGISVRTVQRICKSRGVVKGELSDEVNAPADWGTRSKDVVAQIEIPFEPVAGGSEGAMIAEIKSAVAAEKPMLMMFWQPHWLFAENEFNWVEWDAAEGECVEESGQSKGNACGFQQASIDKVANKDFASTWPGAAALFEAFTIDNDTQNSLMNEIDQKGRDLEEVIAEWIDANEDTWSAWVEAAEAAKS